MRKELGYTLYELVISVIALAIVGVIVGGVITAIHFIVKFW